MSEIITKENFEDTNVLLQNIKEIALRSNQNITSVNDSVLQLGNIHLESKRLDNENLMLKNELATIVSDFKLKQGFLEMVFSERSKIIDKHFEVIDKGMREDNDELVLRGLRGASEFIMKNPLEDFENFKKMILDKDSPLELDF